MRLKKLNTSFFDPITAEQEAPKEFLELPTSPATDFVMQTLGTDGNIERLKDNAKATRNGTEYTIRKKGNARQIEAVKGNQTITIEISNIDNLLGSKKGAKKIFIYNLIEINKQAYSGGVMRQDYITFPLQALVDVGLYSSDKTARVAIKNSFSTLLGLQLKGTLTEQRGRKKAVTIEAVEMPFTGYNIKNGQVTVYLNPRIDYGFLCRFYTVIPSYYFSLPANASDLLYLIFYLARQNISKIKEKGYFDISFRTIHTRLNLPSEIGNTRPQQLIKEPIEKAITEIEEKAHSSDFTLTPYYDENANIKDFLDNGFLRIGLKNNYATAFINLATSKEKAIEQKQKQEAKILERAKEKALTKKLEAEQSTTDTKGGA